MKIAVLALSILFPVIGFTQVITASFDRTTLSKNPAAATTRGYGQAAFFANFRNSKTDINQARSPSETQKIKEDIKIMKSAIYFTGHGRIAPELYLSKDNAEKTFKPEGSTDKQETKIDMVNNFINLGLRLTQHFAVGIKYYRPSFAYKERLSSVFPDGFTAKNNSTIKTTHQGLGFGTTMMIKPKVYLGGYYISITEENKGTQTQTDITNTTSTQDLSGTNKRNQYGFGLSYLDGGRGRGVRIEAAYSRMEHDDLVKAPAGEEVFGALEYSKRSFTFGGWLKFRKNAYYDHLELVDYIIGDKIFSDNFTPSYGGFISLGSGHGHTVGISGWISTTKGTRPIFGEDQEATTKTTQVTFNYAYLF